MRKAKTPLSNFSECWDSGNAQAFLQEVNGHRLGFPPPPRACLSWCPLGALGAWRKELWREERRRGRGGGVRGALRRGKPRRPSPFPLPFSVARSGCAHSALTEDTQAGLLARWGVWRGGVARETSRPRSRLTPSLPWWFLRAPTHVVAAAALDAPKEETHETAAPQAEST